jgi:hypothetical protein
VLQLGPSPSPTSQARAKGLVWAGHTFVDRTQFARWLRARGVRYRVWARRHPQLSGITPRPRADRPARRAAKGNGAVQRSYWRFAKLAGAVAALAVLCLLLALRVRRLVERRRRRASERPARPDEGRGRSFGVLTVLPSAALALREQRWLGGARTHLSVEHHRLAARRTATAASRRARLVVRRANARALLAQSSARSVTRIFGRRRGELGWYILTALLAAGTGLLVTAWLNGA